MVSNNGIAQDVINQNELKDLKEKLLYDFKKFETLEDDSLSRVVEDLNNRTSSYIKLRKQECEGEFSSIELDGNGEKIVSKKKLSKVEKNLCMLELINFQKRFVDTIFVLRRKVLVMNHKKQLNTLEDFQRKQIDNLENIASKYK